MQCTFETFLKDEAGLILWSNGPTSMWHTYVYDKSINNTCHTAALSLTALIFKDISSCYIGLGRIGLMNMKASVIREAFGERW